MGKGKTAFDVTRTIIHACAAGTCVSKAVTTDKPISKVLSSVAAGLQAGLAVEACKDVVEDVKEMKSEKRPSMEKPRTLPQETKPKEINNVITGGEPGNRWKVELIYLIFPGGEYKTEDLSKANRFVFTGIDRDYSPRMALETIRESIGISLDCKKKLKITRTDRGGIIFDC